VYFLLNFVFVEDKYFVLPMFLHIHLIIFGICLLSFGVRSTSFMNTMPKFESTITNRGEKLVGLRELAKHIGCAKCTAQKLKDDGKIP